ncbi:MAG TPA: peptidylprolyl isomerase [Syntrophorhabdaceae bacterium]|nr:peptidylprolyl isomerase [Syntrophorhabdaceae bacterium]HQM81457.1 peptidylprolyl isomerase [Syntrophorhabdaceae bacterium]
MKEAKIHDKVKVHYKGLLQDGTVFDSSENRHPLEFTIGQGMVIPGFENGVLGMREGDTKMIPISAEDAYGPYRNELVGIVDKSRIPDDINLEIGMVLQVRSPEGSVTNVTVVKITDTEVTLDMNHPLAGKDLSFEVTLMQIQQP